MSKVSESSRQQVRQRAKQLCEYCHASEQWQYVLFTSELPTLPYSGKCRLLRFFQELQNLSISDRLFESR